MQQANHQAPRVLQPSRFILHQYIQTQSRIHLFRRRSSLWRPRS
ncbi:hypothetical protein MTR67_001108 [Solanum verrucosum]|uniref:Uncharacterized protein n=1 Tax=Solanum verrucosum TaxID=315347 RepID=A0AAF0PML7_SOLVR|nr:hypothetical protein MTR67_001108 [Solanum verrucosum]